MSDTQQIIITVAIIAVIVLIPTIVLIVNLIKQRKQRNIQKTVELNPQEVADVENEIKNTAKNSITLTIGGKAESTVGKTHFGGVPDVPSDFVWPAFECATFDDDEVKPRHLNFLMQFDLEQAAEFDGDNMLPHEGLLSFFHVVDADVYGDSAKEMDCLRVFWFKDKAALSPAQVPEELKGENTYPALNVDFKKCISYITPDDLFEYYNGGNNALDCYYKAAENIGADRDSCSKLLGWAEWVQYSDIPKFEKLFRGGNAVASDIKNVITQDWALLLQLDPVEDGDFDFDFTYGDCGSLYVYIRKEDLLARRFDKTVFSWQCT